jgi:hypothetical protein
MQMSHRGEYITVWTHNDIVDIAHAQQLQDELSEEEVLQSLLQRDTQQIIMDIKMRIAEGPVRLVVRLISMIDVGMSLYGLQGRAALT